MHACCVMYIIKTIIITLISMYVHAGRILGIIGAVLCTVGLILGGFTAPNRAVVIHVGFPLVLIATGLHLVML